MHPVLSEIKAYVHALSIIILMNIPPLPREYLEDRQMRLSDIELNSSSCKVYRNS